MCGSVLSPVRSGPSSWPQNRRRTRLLRLASVLSLFTSAGKVASAKGTLKPATASRWRSTASRKKVHTCGTAPPAHHAACRNHRTG